MSKTKDSRADEITFVVTTNPLANSAENKKRVRSAAAFKSWPERRKKTFEINRDKLSGSHGGFVLDPSVSAGDAVDEPSAKRVKSQPPKADKTRIIEGNTYDFNAFKSAHLATTQDQSLFERCSRRSSGMCNCAPCRAERRYSRSRERGLVADSPWKPDQPALMSPPASPDLQGIINVGKSFDLGDRFAYSNHYPVPYQPWFDYVLHHMLSVFGPKAWPTLGINAVEGRCWDIYMSQLALTEPALFYVRLLFATGDLLRLGAVSPKATYWLQGQAVQAINEALSDPKRATSDALILAVGRIAIHETLYGDRAAALYVHRPAQKRMVSMRGGMRALPYPELVKRLMRWGDTVMATLTATPRILEDEEEHKNMDMRQTLDVLAKWSPYHGKNLAKKITIDQLLSPAPSGSPSNSTDTS